MPTTWSLEKSFWQPKLPFWWPKPLFQRLVSIFQSPEMTFSPLFGARRRHFEGGQVTRANAPTTIGPITRDVVSTAEAPILMTKTVTLTTNDDNSITKDVILATKAILQWPKLSSWWLVVEVQSPETSFWWQLSPVWWLKLLDPATLATPVVVSSILEVYFT